MTTLLLTLVIAQARPVIRLEDSVLKGDIRKPSLVEVKGTDLDRTIQEAALRNLIQLEAKLLKLRPHEMTKQKGIND